MPAARRQDAAKPRHGPETGGAAIPQAPGQHPLEMGLGGFRFVFPLTPFSLERRA
jgi:hypothetical protein